MKESLENKTDEELYELMSQNKQMARKAFDVIYQRYNKKIYTYCIKVLNDAETAQDIFQEIFVRLFESRKLGKEMTNFHGFLIVLARNLCLNEKKKKVHETTQLQDYHNPVNEIENNYENEYITNAVDKALMSLQDDFREPIILREYLDMSYKEIADTLGENIDSIRIRIYRGKLKLKELLSPLIKNEIEIINNKSDSKL